MSGIYLPPFPEFIFLHIYNALYSRSLITRLLARYSHLPINAIGINTQQLPAKQGKGEEIMITQHLFGTVNIAGILCFLTTTVLFSVFLLAAANLSSVTIFGKTVTRQRQIPRLPARKRSNW